MPVLASVSDSIIPLCMQAATPRHDSQTSYVQGHPVAGVYYPPKPEPTPTTPTAQSQRGRRCSRKLCIVLVVAAAVMVVALALGLGLGLGLKPDDKPTLKKDGSACDTFLDCVNTCIAGTCSPYLSDDASCTSTTECRNNCVSGTCTSLIADREQCDPDVECASGACGVQSNVCLLSAGVACRDSVMCGSGRCLNNMCT